MTEFANLARDTRRLDQAEQCARDQFVTTDNARHITLTRRSIDDLDALAELLCFGFSDVAGEYAMMSSFASGGLPMLATPMLSPEDIVVTRTDLARATGAVANLPTRERQAVVLAASGAKYQEMAAVLGVSPRTVEGTLWRARRKLRAALMGANPLASGRRAPW